MTVHSSNKRQNGEKSMREGYLLLAVDRQRYFDMACSLAYSIRVFDPARPIAVVVDASIAVNDKARLFDRVIVVEPQPPYVGVLNKLRLLEINPFERALFVDSDCLMVRPDVSAYWESFTGGCTTPGEVITGGSWKGLDIAAAIQTLQIPHMVRLNAGVVFFDHSPLAETMFGYMRDLLANMPKGVTQIHQNRPGQYSEEPLLGAAMAKYGVAPLKSVPGIGSLMVTTLYARHVAVDYDRGVAYLEKANISSRREWITPWRVKWTKHSPIFMHFIGLKPDAVYQQACARFAKEVRAKAV